MWRFRFLIKGSEQELKWLNKLAKRGWCLAGIHGNWYRFKHVRTTFRIFSEYVPSELVTEITKANRIFQVLATVQVKKPDIQVVYTGSDRPEVIQAQVSPGDLKMRLDVALGMRDKTLNTMNVFIFLGVGFLGVLPFLLQNDNQLVLFQLYILFALCVLLCFWLSAKNLQKQIVILRRETRDYDGAWMPTMHVYIEPLPAELDTEALKSVGRWRLVGHTRKNGYSYELQTLASESEIKQVLRPVVPSEATVYVVSWLGLAPIGWFI